MAIMIFILLFSIPVIAPGYKTLCIVRTEPINYYENLIQAVVKVESNGNRYAFNALEGAIGAFQIRECRIQHYNRLTGSKYVLNDCYDYELSRKVFLYFCQDRNYELVARSWNGTGEMTKQYWNKIKANL